MPSYTTEDMRRAIDKVADQISKHRGEPKDKARRRLVRDVERNERKQKEKGNGGK